MCANKTSTGAAVALPRCQWIITSIYTKPGPGALLDLSNIPEEGFPIVKQSQLLRNLFYMMLLIPHQQLCTLGSPTPQKKPKIPHDAQHAVA